LIIADQGQLPARPLNHFFKSTGAFSHLCFQKRNAFLEIRVKKYPAEKKIGYFWRSFIKTTTTTTTTNGPFAF
jgi:hypothetical protein